LLQHPSFGQDAANVLIWSEGDRLLMVERTHFRPFSADAALPKFCRSFILWVGRISALVELLERLEISEICNRRFAAHMLGHIRFI
jgi:hypothetical protein